MFSILHPTSTNVANKSNRKIALATRGPKNKDNPARLSLIQLMGVGAHVGQPKRHWVQESEPVLVGYRHGVAIFNLSQTLFYAKRAFKFVEMAVSRYAKGFFYGFSGPGDVRSVAHLKHAGQIVSFERWHGGFLTNMRSFRRYIHNVGRIPAFMVSFNFELSNYSVLREKHRMRIPGICPLDSDSDPAYAEYPIPGNAGGRANIGYYGRVFSTAAFSGTMRRIAKFLIAARYARVKQKARKDYKKEYTLRWKLRQQRLAEQAQLKRNSNTSSSSTQHNQRTGSRSHGQRAAPTGATTTYSSQPS